MHGLAGAGMGEAEFPGMQHLAGIMARRSRRVKGVAQERMAEVFHVDPDLMGPAGVQGAFDNRADAGQLLGYAPGGEGGAAAPVEHSHFFALDGVAANQGLDGPAARSGKESLDEGEVDFCDGTGGKLAGEMGMGGVVPGDHEASAGVLVEPVDDPGPPLAADAGKRGAMRQQGMDQSMAGMAGGGVDHQARRLVEDHDIGVFEEDIERDVLGLEQGGLGGRLGQGDQGAGPDFVARFGGLSLEGGVALPDEGLQAGAREVRQLSREEPVQPIPRGACIDSELRHLRE